MIRLIWGLIRKTTFGKSRVVKRTKIHPSFFLSPSIKETHQQVTFSHSSNFNARSFSLNLESPTLSDESCNLYDSQTSFPDSNSIIVLSSSDNLKNDQINNSSLEGSMIRSETYEYSEISSEVDIFKEYPKLFGIFCRCCYISSKLYREDYDRKFLETKGKL